MLRCANLKASLRYSPPGAPLRPGRAPNVKLWLALSSLLMATLITGCEDKVAKQKADREFEEQQAALEAVEKEAHRAPRAWYEVKVGKYDGECMSLNGSARADVDSYHSYSPRLQKALKEGDEYLLIYDLGSPYYRKYFTTSAQWCENFIKANISR